MKPNSIDIILKCLIIFFLIHMKYGNNISEVLSKSSVIRNSNL